MRDNDDDSSCSDCTETTCYTCTSLEQVGCDPFVPEYIFEDAGNGNAIEWDQTGATKLNSMILKDRKRCNQIRAMIDMVVNLLYVFIRVPFINTFLRIHSRRSCLSIASVRRKVSATNQERVVMTSDTNIRHYSGTCELDSHADTCVLGKNFVPLYYTGEVCDVHAFSPDHTPVSNVRIGGGATLWFDPTNGAGYIIVINQALMFTDSLEHSLLNPNQIRLNGHSLCEDPWDKHRSIGITPSDHDTFIPFQATGPILHFKSTTPTLEDMATYPHIQLTADEPWDPANVALFSLSKRQREIMAITPHSGISEKPEDFLMPRVNVMANPEEAQMMHHESTYDRVLSSVSSIYSIINSYHRLAHSAASSVARCIGNAVSSKRHTDVSADSLAKLWNIGKGTASETIKATTQLGTRHAVRPLSRRYRTDVVEFLSKKRLNCRLYSDTLFSKVKSLKQNTCAQVFVTENYVKVHPMRSKQDAGEAFREFTEDVGAPNEIVVDQAKEQVAPGSLFRKIANWVRSKLLMTEKGSGWQNRAEATIGLLKKRWRQRIVKNNVPTRLWDYALIYDAEILSRTVTKHGERTGYEKITGDTPDISEWCDFAFYQFVWYWDTPKPPEEKGSKLGRWLGVSHRIGSPMCY